MLDEHVTIGGEGEGEIDLLITVFVCWGIGVAGVQYMLPKNGSNRGECKVSKS